MGEMNEALNDDSSMLVILLETNPAFWESPKGRSLGCAAANGLEATLRQLMVFINGGAVQVHPALTLD